MLKTIILKLVSSIDDYDLQTPPASPFSLPSPLRTDISRSGVFYFTINTGDKAKWINYITKEKKPERTNITYYNYELRVLNNAGNMSTLYNLTATTQSN